MSQQKPRFDPSKNALRAQQAAQRKARRFALQGLYEWHLTSNPSHDIMARTHAENAMHKVDTQYYQQMLTLIIRDHERLDRLISQVIDRDFDSLDGVERAVLRIGTFELRDRVEIPYKVVIDEAIELVKHFGATDSHKFINGVLDKLARHLRYEETGDAPPAPLVDESTPATHADEADE